MPGILKCECSHSTSISRPSRPPRAGRQESRWISGTLRREVGVSTAVDAPKSILPGKKRSYFAERVEPELTQPSQLDRLSHGIYEEVFPLRPVRRFSVNWWRARSDAPYRFSEVP